MKLLQIGGVDYTSHIINGSYNVNLVPIYTDWVDGYHVTHRDIYRWIPRGSFRMRFFNNTELEAFLAALGRPGQISAAYLFLPQMEGIFRIWQFVVDYQVPMIRYAHGGINYGEFTVNIEGIGA